MKKYKYVYSKTVTILFIVGILIAIASIILNAYRFILKMRGEYEITGYEWFTLGLTVALSILFIVIAVSCFISSSYKVENKNLVLNWGFIKNKLDLLEVTKMNYYPNKNRLELIFNDESYFYVSTTPEWVGDLVDDIKLANSKIIYVEETINEEK